MKRIAVILGCLAMLFAACKKKDDNKTTATSIWQVGGRAYTTTTTSRAGNNGFTLNAEAGNSLYGSRLKFIFRQMPATGNYKITSSIYPAADEVGISLSVFDSVSSKSYYSIDDTSKTTATVTIADNKINIVVPRIYLLNTLFFSDYETLTANVREQ